jgi:myosin V
LSLGIQIEHNVTVLESWCSQEGISDASIHLQHLMQAAKLLTLNKSSNSDINTIFERCFHLNANQIKKLLSLYHADDFDSPLSDEVMKNVSIRAATSGDQSILLALDDSAEFSIPKIREVQVIEKFIPAWIELPFIQAVLSAAFPSKIK